MGPKDELPWDPLNLIAISKFPWQQFEDPNLGLWFPEIWDTPKNPKFQTGLEPVKITFQPHFWRFHVAFQAVVCPWARTIAEPKKVLAAESGEISWKPTSFPIKIGLPENVCYAPGNHPWQRFGVYRNGFAFFYMVDFQLINRNFVPSGKHTKNYGKSLCYQWVNPL